MMQVSIAQSARHFERGPPPSDDPDPASTLGKKPTLMYGCEHQVCKRGTTCPDVYICKLDLIGVQQIGDEVVLTFARPCALSVHFKTRQKLTREQYDALVERGHVLIVDHQLGEHGMLYMYLATDPETLVSGTSFKEASSAGALRESLRVIAVSDTDTVQ